MRVSAQQPEESIKRKEGSRGLRIGQNERKNALGRTSKGTQEGVNIREKERSRHRGQLELLAVNHTEQKKWKRKIKEGGLGVRRKTRPRQTKLGRRRKRFPAHTKRAFRRSLGMWEVYIDKVEGRHQRDSAFAGKKRGSWRNFEKRWEASRFF